MVTHKALRYRERAMGGCSSQSVARSVGVALGVLLAACSGGSDAGGGKASPKTSTPASSTPPPTIDLSKPIPGGSLHGTPRPALENTGTDYVAIFKSLTGNFRWLTENPNPGVLSELFVPGTPPHDERVAAYQYLEDNRYRWADEGYRVLQVDVVDAQGDSVALRVVEELAYERLVDESGNQVGETRPHGSPENVTVLLNRSADGHWRVASTSRVQDSVVQL